jgi:hypothetical protein
MLLADLERHLADVLEENAAVRAEFLQVQRRWDWRACRLVESAELPAGIGTTTLAQEDFD